MVHRYGQVGAFISNAVQLAHAERPAAAREHPEALLGIGDQAAYSRVIIDSGGAESDRMPAHARAALDRRSANVLSICLLQFSQKFVASQNMFYNYMYINDILK